MKLFLLVDIKQFAIEPKFKWSVGKVSEKKNSLKKEKLEAYYNIYI